MFKLNPAVDLKRRQRKMLEGAIALSIAIHILIFVIFPRFEFEPVEIAQATVLVKVDEIEQTQQIKRPPPPNVPSVPIESEDEDIADENEKRLDDIFKTEKTVKKHTNKRMKRKGKQGKH